MTSVQNNTFGAYQNEGRLVDRKGYNLHISGIPETSTYMTAAGTSCFLAANSGDIPTGCIVIDSGTSGTSGATSGYINVSTGASNELILGVAVDERQAGDKRPITITWCGYVRCVAGYNGVTAGDFIQPDDNGTSNSVSTYGAAKTWADVITNAGTTLIAQKKKIGKALTTATIGQEFDAFINCAGV